MLKTSLLKIAIIPCDEHLHFSFANIKFENDEQSVENTFECQSSKIKLPILRIESILLDWVDAILFFSWIGLLSYTAQQRLTLIMEVVDEGGLWRGNEGDRLSQVGVNAFLNNLLKVIFPWIVFPINSLYFSIHSILSNVALHFLFFGSTLLKLCKSLNKPHTWLFYNNNNNCCCWGAKTNCSIPSK